MNKEQLVSSLVTLLVYCSIGAFGSLLEKFGAARKLPKLEAFGKLLESIAADGPKAGTNAKAMFGKSEPPAQG